MLVVCACPPGAFYYAESVDSSNFCQPHILHELSLKAFVSLFYFTGAPVNGSMYSFIVSCSYPISSCSCCWIYSAIAFVFFPTVLIQAYVRAAPGVYRLIRVSDDEQVFVQPRKYCDELVFQFGHVLKLVHLDVF